MTSVVDQIFTLGYMHDRGHEFHLKTFTSTLILRQLMRIGIGNSSIKSWITLKYLSRKTKINSKSSKQEFQIFERIVVGNEEQPGDIYFIDSK